MNKVPAPMRKVFPAMCLEMTEVGAVEAHPGVPSSQGQKDKGSN